MRSLVIIIAGFFSFIYIDLNKFRKSSSSVFTVDSISIELSEKREKLKKKQRKYKKRRDFHNKHYKLKGTHSKDSRYSNQDQSSTFH